MSENNMNEEMKKKIVAYALNLWTVSMAQIIEYNDVNIMRQEYDNIMNNLNLEHMPKDETLLETIKAIMDEITQFTIDENDRKILEMEYRNEVKNNIWNSAPNVGAIFASANPVAIGLTLATQVGSTYMNYRKNMAQMERNYEKGKWAIQKNRLQHLNGLQQQLFETAWRLADAYEFSDKYRLTQNQITEYNKALTERNFVKRYEKLKSMSESFAAYPTFWYQLGSTANSIYRGADIDVDQETRNIYANKAIEYFKRYEEFNEFSLLRYDVIKASWALEYLEVLGYSRDNNFEKAKEYIKIAEDNANCSLDIIELCAFEYMRIYDYENAARLFKKLVTDDYNAEMNTQILSGLYIHLMRSSDETLKENAKFSYEQLRSITDANYILEIPKSSVNLEEWKPDWNKSEGFNDFCLKQTKEKEDKRKAKEEAKKKAYSFYSQSIVIVTEKKEIAQLYIEILGNYRKQVDERLPGAIRVSIDEYDSRLQEFDQNKAKVIMIGDFKNSKTIYKDLKRNHWEYDKFGMKYLTSGNYVVILRKNIGNKELDELMALAKSALGEKSNYIPADVESVKETLFKGLYNKEDGFVLNAIATVVLSPLLAFGAGCESIVSIYQKIVNLSKKDQIRILQYVLVFIEYLKSQDAIF